MGVVAAALLLSPVTPPWGGQARPRLGRPDAGRAWPRDSGVRLGEVEAEEVEAEGGPPAVRTQSGMVDSCACPSATAPLKCTAGRPPVRRTASARARRRMRGGCGGGEQACES